VGCEVGGWSSVGVGEWDVGCEGRNGEGGSVEGGSGEDGVSEGGSGTVVTSCGS